jgi:hypothetical protein
MTRQQRQAAAQKRLYERRCGARHGTSSQLRAVPARKHAPRS